MEKMLESYLVAALWSSTDEDGEPLDKNYALRDFAPKSIKSARKACEFFEDRARPWLGDMEPGRIGHNLWLSRNGHGSGFFDEDTCREEWRDVLQRKAQALGESDCYVGDDGKIYLS